MRTIRVPLSSLRPGDLELDREAARYVSRVLRLEVGASLVVFDPAAKCEADARVLSTEKGRVRIEIDPPRAASIVARRAVTLIQCVGKGEKLDAVVRDATELGATAVWPALSARTVAARASPQSVERLRRVALEAARQCGRGDVPMIAEPRPLSELLAETRADHRVAFAVGGTERFADHAGGAGSLCLVVGPEGGLTDAEVGAARASGFAVASLGPFVLRTETVAAAALGAALVLGD